MAELNRLQIVGLLNSGGLFAGLDLRHADLKGLDLSKARLVNTDARGADMRGCILFPRDTSDPATLERVRGLKLGGADLRGILATDGMVDQAARAKLTVARADAASAIFDDEEAKAEKGRAEAEEFRRTTSPAVFDAQTLAEIQQMRASGETPQAVDAMIRKRRAELAKRLPAVASAILGQHAEAVKKVEAEKEKAEEPPTESWASREF